MWRVAPPVIEEAWTKRLRGVRICAIAAQNFGRQYVLSVEAIWGRDLATACAVDHGIDAFERIGEPFGGFEGRARDFDAECVEVLAFGRRPNGRANRMTLF